MDETGSAPATPVVDFSSVRDRAVLAAHADGMSRRELGVAFNLPESRIWAILDRTRPGAGDPAETPTPAPDPPGDDGVPTAPPTPPDGPPPDLGDLVPVDYPGRSGGRARGPAEALARSDRDARVGTLWEADPAATIATICGRAAGIGIVLSTTTVRQLRPASLGVLHRQRPGASPGGRRPHPGRDAVVALWREFPNASFGRIQSLLHDRTGHTMNRVVVGRHRPKDLGNAVRARLEARLAERAGQRAAMALELAAAREAKAAVGRPARAAKRAALAVEAKTTLAAARALTASQVATLWAADPMATSETIRGRMIEAHGRPLSTFTIRQLRPSGLPPLNKGRRPADVVAPVDPVAVAPPVVPIAGKAATPAPAAPSPTLTDPSSLARRAYREPDPRPVRRPRPAVWPATTGPVRPAVRRSTTPEAPAGPRPTDPTREQIEAAAAEIKARRLAEMRDTPEKLKAREAAARNRYLVDHRTRQARVQAARGSRSGGSEGEKS
jgi:hypothetical protein